MSFVSGCRRVATGCAVFICAIVCGCSGSDADVTRPAPSSSASGNPAPEAAGTSELQDWARQATGSAGGDTTRDTSASPAATGSAQAAPDTLATPVIHTVD
jgi:hypothetical protein